MSINNNYVYDPDDEEEDYEATDYLYRPKKQNSRKSLVPLLVYLILVNYSSPKRHLSQNAVLKILARYPYEVKLERKALNRVIHGLADSGVGVAFKKGDGCWFDEDSVWESGLSSRIGGVCGGDLNKIKPAA